MTQIHEQILKTLNEVYVEEECIGNAKRLVEFVDKELQIEMLKALEHIQGKQLADKLFQTIVYAFIGTFIAVFVPFSKFISLLIGVGASITMWILFKNKLSGLIAKRLDKSSPKRFKIFDLYFQAKDQVEKFNFEQEKENKELELIGKYLDRNGNEVEVEKFKCENPKKTILAPFTCTCGRTIGMLCRSVLMQKSVLSPMMFPLSGHTIETKLAQVEFEKELPVSVIEMIDSCATYNMQMQESLYWLIRELNVSESTPDYSYIKQFIDEYEQNGLSEFQAEENSSLKVSENDDVNFQVIAAERSSKQLSSILHEICDSLHNAGQEYWLSQSSFANKIKENPFEFEKKLGEFMSLTRYLAKEMSSNLHYLNDDEYEAIMFFIEHDLKAFTHYVNEDIDLAKYYCLVFKTQKGEVNE